jgi:chromosome segregation ATPase
MVETEAEVLVSEKPTLHMNLKTRNKQLEEELSTERESSSKKDNSIKRLKEMGKSLRKALKTLKTESLKKENLQKKTLQLCMKEKNAQVKQIAELNCTNAVLQEDISCLKRDIEAERNQVKERSLEIVELQQMVKRWKRIAEERDNIAKSRLSQITDLEESLLKSKNMNNEKKPLCEEKLDPVNKSSKDVLLKERQDEVIQTKVLSILPETDSTDNKTLTSTNDSDKEMISVETLCIKDGENLSATSHAYLKQAIYKYFITESITDRAQLAQVISKLLRYTPSEQSAIIQSVRKNESGVLNSVTKWLSPY